MEEGKTLPATFKLKQSFLFARRNTNWNLPGLALTEVTLYQPITLLRLLLRFKKTCPTFLSFSD